MKHQEIIFKHPVKILQIFRNIILYGKQARSFEDRKERLKWKEIESKNGYVLNNELYLPEQILTNPDLLSCDLITIEDDNQLQPFTSYHLQFSRIISSGHKPVSNQCINVVRNNNIDIFELKMKEELELYLRYGYYEVGIPKRENFKLCNIQENLPIEIKINGKTDFALSSGRGGRERIFKEQYYIFNYIGDFQKCKILKEPCGSNLKIIPENRKVIDMIKQLW